MIKTTCRLAITIALITGCAIWAALGIQILPDSGQRIVSQRSGLCESLAISTSWYARNGQPGDLDLLVEEIGRHDPAIVSIGVLQGESLIAEYGDHSSSWQGTSERLPGGSMQSTVQAGGQPWGLVQVQFANDPMMSGIGNFLLITFCSALVGLITWLYLARSFKYLTPAKFIPERVRHALDAMAEGLLLLDTKLQIVLANASFAEIAEQPVESLLGSDPGQLDWYCEQGQPVLADDLPWRKCARERQAQRGQMLVLKKGEDRDYRLMVNATPIIESNGDCRGILASFDDVTDLEEKRVEMGRMLSVLKTSRDEIRRQNEQLHFLAARDPLTGCLNRRSFYMTIGELWKDKVAGQLAMLMIDIDKFKSINDNFGHAAGDDVIKAVAVRIARTLPETALICRYGGEEFCVALPDTSFAEAMTLASELREGIAAAPVGNVACTTSIGVSEREFLAMDPQHLIDQADQCLFIAKRGGRNRVVGWPESGSEFHMQIEADSYTDAGGARSHRDEQVIVATLFTALHYRDPNTALHSARVASLARELGSRFLGDEALQNLKTAALLHDIGKIGIPDSLLHRPDHLTESEMKFMRRKGDIAVSISQSGLLSTDISTIIANYAEHFRNGDGWGELDQRHPDICRSCHILHLCDAFDSLINDQEYRIAKSLEETIRILRDNSPRQFDPDLVEILVDCVAENPDCMSPIAVTGAILNQEVPTDSDSLISAVQSGDMAPLRMLMRRLKREALSESPEFQKTIERLECNLKRNDDELQRLFQATQDILEMCRQNSLSSEGLGVIDWLNK
jgi:diguanylate cyclase (GGDEF)-like protein